MQYKVTFLYKNYVANISFQEADSEEEAIESAKLYNINDYTSVYAEEA